jgi:hypothetical protein
MSHMSDGRSITSEKGARDSHLIEHVETCQIRVREGASGEASEDPASTAAERAGGEHKVGDLPCRSPMAEEDDPPLGDERVEEKHDWVRRRSRRVQGRNIGRAEGRRGRRHGGEGLDEVDERKPENTQVR